MMQHTGSHAVESKWLTGLAFTWPIVVAVLAAASCYVIQPEWHQFGTGAMFVAVVGAFSAPVVGSRIFLWMPARWPEETRGGIAALLTIPVACFQAYAAV